MIIKKSKFKSYIELNELDYVRNAILSWGKSQEVANVFNGCKISEYLEQWENFVETDWEGWDQSEYDHEIGCRTWIQLIIEHVGDHTKNVILKELEPIDNIFTAKMMPKKACHPVNSRVFKSSPYFWEIYTIHPEL